jgi:hypothetical protein
LKLFGKKKKKQDELDYQPTDISDDKTDEEESDANDDVDTDVDVDID